MAEPVFRSQLQLNQEEAEKEEKAVAVIIIIKIVFLFQELDDNLYCDEFDWSGFLS